MKLLKLPDWVVGLSCIWKWHDFILNRETPGVVRLKCLRCGYLSPGWEIEAVKQLEARIGGQGEGPSRTQT